MIVSIKIDSDRPNAYLTLANDQEDETKVFIDIDGKIVHISIEELKHALRKISCK